MINLLYQRKQIFGRYLSVPFQMIAWSEVTQVDLDGVNTTAFVESSWWHLSWDIPS